MDGDFTAGLVPIASGGDFTAGLVPMKAQARPAPLVAGALERSGFPAGYAPTAAGPRINQPNIYNRRGQLVTRGMQMTTEPTLGDYLGTAINLGTDTAPGAESATPAVGTEEVGGYRQATAPGATADQRMAGAARMVGATGEALSPMMGPELYGGLGQLVKLGGGLGLGIAGSKAAPAVVQHYGGGPGAQQLAGELGQWIPSAVGMLAGAASPEDYATTRGNTVDALTRDILARGGVDEPLARETAQGMMRRYEQSRDPRWLDATNATATGELPNTSFGRALGTKALQGAAALQGGARGALAAGLGQEQPQEPAPSPRSSAVNDFIGKSFMRAAMEAEGQGVLDDMTDQGLSPKDVSKQFWEQTYFNLPAQVQAKFRNYLTQETGGLKPGDTIGFTRNREPIIAQDWAHLASTILDLPDDPEHLEGTERGLVALMKVANERYGARTPSSVAPQFAALGQPRTAPEEIGPALEALQPRGTPRRVEAVTAAHHMNTYLDEGGPNTPASVGVDDLARGLIMGASRASGQPMGGAWKGINLQREHAQNISFVLSDLADRLEESGLGADRTQAIANLRKLASQLDRVDELNYDPNAGHAGVPLVHDPAAAAHEIVTHGGQRALAGGTGDIRNFTDHLRTLADPNDVDYAGNPNYSNFHPAVDKAIPRLRQWGYDVNEPAVISAEMQAHILDRNWERLGLTKQEAIDWMKHSLDVLNQFHGPDKMGENIPRLAQGYVEAIKNLIGEQGETGATAEGSAATAAQPEGAGVGYGDNAPAGETAEGGAGRGGGAPAVGTAEEVGPSLASQADDEAWRVSTRNPTGKSTKTRTVEDPLKENLQIDTQAIRDSDLETEIAKKLRRFPGMNLSGPAESVIQGFLKQAVNNLVWLHDQFPKEWRDQARKWYDGANQLAEQWSGDYGVHKAQVAAVIASQSPQKDWHMNVSLAQRILDTYGKAQRGEIEYTPKMDKKAIQLGNKARADALKAADKLEAKGKLEQAAKRRAAANNTAKAYKAIAGKNWDELSSQAEKARWIRLYDEAENARTYNVYAPDGSVIGPARTDKGNIKNVAWGSNSGIAKAVSMLEDGSRANISKQLGNAHKIRSFYNNIIAPNSTAGDVTVDTHAVAANTLRALAGSDKAVQQNFGGVGSKMTGVAGAYGLHADAYRIAAEQLGLLPRELQSITWEAVRSLFSPAFKRSKGKAIIDKIWREHAANETPIAQTRDRIFNAANRFDKPSWAEPIGGGSSVGGNEVAGAAANQGVVSGAGISGGGAGEAIGGRGGPAAGAVPTVGGRVRQPAGRGPSRGGVALPIPPQLRRVIRK